MNPNIILGILSVVFGLLIIRFPTDAISAIVIFIGICAVINGILTIIRAKKLYVNPLFVRTVTIRSCFGILIGLFAVILPFAFFTAITTIVRVLLYIQGVFLLVSSISEAILFFKMKPESKWLLVKAGGPFLVAIFLFLLPANFGVIIVRIIGALLLAFGVVYIIREWQTSPVEVEAEIKEEE